VIILWWNLKIIALKCYWLAVCLLKPRLNLAARDPVGQNYALGKAGWFACSE